MIALPGSLLRRSLTALLVTGASAAFAGCASSVSEPASPDTPPASAMSETAQRPRAAEPSAAPRSPAPADEVSGETAGVCDLVCEQATVSSVEDGTSDLTSVKKNADVVLGEMQPDILACYKKRVVAKPGSQAVLTLDITINPDGTVQQVDTTGGEVLGKGTTSCIATRVQKGVFAPPRRGGTLHIYVPFTLRPAGST